MGYLLSAKSFAPITKFSKVIDDIDLEKLDHTVPVSGHPDDELYILGTRFNEMLLRLKIMSQQQKEFISNVSHE
jgi:methyl-accepting chemotaxis protein